MTDKYEQVCWFCGGKEIYPDDKGFRCSKCGATWNKIPKMGSSAITIDLVTASDGLLSAGKTHSRPSGGTARRAARAREGLPPKRAPK